MRSWYRIEAKAKDVPEAVDVYLFDAIGAIYGGTDARKFVEDLAGLDASVTTIRVHVNSPGGDVFDAVAIANALREHPARVETTIEGLAASAATIITSGGSDLIRVRDNALVFVHDPWTIAAGNSADMRKLADELDVVRDAILVSYERHSELSREELAALMAAETWMSAEEAVANGFADEVVEAEGEEVDATFSARAVAALKVPERYAARIAAFVRPDEPSASNAAAAVDVIRALKAGGIPDLEGAEDLIAASATMDQVRARVEQLRSRRRIASAADLLRVLNDAGISDVAIASELFAAGATMQQVVARVKAEVALAENAQRIRAMCEVAGHTALAEGFVKARVPAAHVGRMLTTINALIDEAIEIDGSLPPDGQRRRRPQLDVVAIYHALNTPNGE